MADGAAGGIGSHNADARDKDDTSAGRRNGIDSGDGVGENKGAGLRVRGVPSAFGRIDHAGGGPDI